MSSDNQRGFFVRGKLHQENQPGTLMRSTVLGVFRKVSEMEELRNRPHNLLEVFYQSLGSFYSLAIPLAALVSLLAVVVLLRYGKGHLTGTAIIFFCALPALVGFYAKVQGLFNASETIAFSGASVKLEELVMDFSTAIISTIVGILLATPTYFIAAIGCFIRSLSAKPESK